MKEPTPRPWVVDFNHRIVDGEGEPIADCKVVGAITRLSNQKPAADAALIVRAVNAHDDLVAALRALVDKYAELVNGGDCGFWNPENEDEMKAARTAIAKALSP